MMGLLRLSSMHGVGCFDLIRKHLGFMGSHDERCVKLFVSNEQQTPFKFQVPSSKFLLPPSLPSPSI